MRCVSLLLLVLFECGITNASTVYAGTPPLSSASQPEATLAQKDIVGLWSGDVRVPGRVDLWQFLPRLVHYRDSGISVTIYLHNTVLFRRDGTFRVIIEGERTASQYEGHYNIGNSALTMTFSNSALSANAAEGSTGYTFRYPLSRWSNELMLTDPKQAGFQTLLSPMAIDWQPRKGSLVYQGPDGQVEIGISGDLSQQYHYEEDGVIHYAEVSAAWHLVPSQNLNHAPLVKLEGVRDGVNFKTVLVPINTIAGMASRIKQVQASKTTAGYFYSLKLLEVADAKPTRYVWQLQFEFQAGWEVNQAPLAPSILYPSLASPDLRQWIAHLPHGTAINYTPKQMFRFNPVDKAIDPSEPEHGIADFAHYCKVVGIDFGNSYSHYF